MCADKSHRRSSPQKYNRPPIFLKNENAIKNERHTNTKRTKYETCAILHRFHILFIFSFGMNGSYRKN